MLQTSPSERSHEALRGKKILVLEDEPLIALDLSLALEAFGAQVSGAFTVAQAMKLVEDEPPDAAILDVNLGGERTCEPLAFQLREQGTPFILHSGDLDRNGELISRLGAPIVRKPALSQEVIETLLGVIS